MVLLQGQAMEQGLSELCDSGNFDGVHAHICTISTRILSVIHLMPAFYLNFFTVNPFFPVGNRFGTAFR
jgi:hypothetical protein